MKKVIGWFSEAKEQLGFFFLCLVFLVYFLQGLRSFASTATFYVLKQEFNATPSMTQAVKVAVSQPWNIKWLYGIISDNIPINGFHVKPYLYVASLFSAVGHLGLSTNALSYNILSYTIYFTIIQFAGALADVLVDSLVVKVGRQTQGGTADLQSFSWIAFAIGGISANLLGGAMVEFINPRFFLVCLLPTPFLMLYCTYRTPEEKSTTKVSWSNAQAQVMILFKAFFAKPYLVLKCFCWIFMSNALGFSIEDGMTYFRNSIHLTPDVLGYADAFSYVGLLVGTVVYAKYLKQVAFRKIFFWAQLAKVLFSLLDLIQLTRLNIQWGIPDLAFVMGFGTVYEVFSRFKAMPFLVLSAQLCPPHCEATFFALLMSISNFSYSVSGLIGSQFLKLYHVDQTHFEGLEQLVLLRSVGLALPLIFLYLVPDTTSVAGPTSTATDETIELTSSVEDSEETILNSEVVTIRPLHSRSRTTTKDNDEEYEQFIPVEL